MQFDKLSANKRKVLGVLDDEPRRTAQISRLSGINNRGYVARILEDFEDIGLVKKQNLNPFGCTNIWGWKRG